MAAWMVEILYSESDMPNMGPVAVKYVVCADTFDNAQAAMRAHQFYDKCGCLEEILSIQRITDDDVIDIDGVSVRGMKEPA